MAALSRDQVGQLIAGTNLDGRSKRAFIELFNSMFDKIEGLEPRASGVEPSAAQRQAAKAKPAKAKKGAGNE